MMRGPFKQAIVCRTEDGLVEKVEDLKWIKDRYPILGWPFIRGIIVFLDSMIKGVKALTFSAADSRSSRRSPLKRTAMGDSTIW